jgi:hypothetical protein
MKRQAQRNSAASIRGFLLDKRTPSPSGYGVYQKLVVPLGKDTLIVNPNATFDAVHVSGTTLTADQQVHLNEFHRDVLGPYHAKVMERVDAKIDQLIAQGKLPHAPSH